MRNRSETWRLLAARGNFRMETVAVINGVEYSTITAPVITNGLLPNKTLSVGNCIAGTLKFVVKTNDIIPKSAEVIIKARITDETTYSEWLEFGHFWIDKRTINSDLDTNLVGLECFDAMLKGNQAYADSSQTVNWPKPMQTVVNRIAQQMGVQVDSRTVIKTGDEYIVYKPDDETNLLDILSYIGAVHGGNWTITPENKLRLVPLVSAPPETFYIVDEDFDRIQTTEGDNLVSQHGESFVMPNGIGRINVPVVLGEITTAKTYEISRITMTVDEETSYTAGNDTGYELIISTPYASQAMCNALLSELGGIVYNPFNMTEAVFDPAVELGDMLFAGDRVHSVMYTATQRFDVTYTVDAAAPGEDELESEYPYVTALQKTKYEIRTLKQDNTRIWSSISQTNDAIALEVTRATGAESNLSGRIDVNAGNIALKVSKDSVIAEINASTETSGGSAVQIRADKVNLTGYATFTSLRTAGQSVINGDNITDGSISDAHFTSETQAKLVGSSTAKTQYYLSTSPSSVTGGAWSDTVPAWSQNRYVWTRVATTVTMSDGTTTDTRYSTAVYDQNLTTALATAATAASDATNAQTTANNAQARSQTIYKSVASSATVVSANTTWVLDVTGNQNVWTTVRPAYNANYPVLYTATQSQTITQFENGTGTVCSCTTPVTDLTTTVIDGGHITTGYINANRISGGTIDGNTVNAKQLQIVDANNNVIASFSGSVVIGKTNDVHAEVDADSFVLYDKNGNTITVIGDARAAGSSTSLYHYDFGSRAANSTIGRYSACFGTNNTASNWFSHCEGFGNTSSGYAAHCEGNNTTASNNYAHSEGNHSTASGDCAHAEGYYTTASGNYSHAEGNTTTASGGYSHAEGNTTTASGAYSHAEGQNTIASDIYAHAEGCRTTASAAEAHAEGYGTTASGINSHAEGQNTKAYGGYSHAEGCETTAGSASVNGSHAEGYRTTSSGFASHAEGENTTASESAAHAEGDATQATGYCSHAEGHGTIANKESQHVVGRWNVPDSAGAGSLTYIEIVGNGTEASRLNIRTLDYAGNEWIGGGLTQASDQRLKTECGEVPDVSDIKARLFKWNDKKLNHDDKEHIGYFAQDVEEVAPYLVDEDAMGYKSLDYNGILVAKIASLERRVAELEKLVGGLNGR